MGKFPPSDFFSHSLLCSPWLVVLHRKQSSQSCRTPLGQPHRTPLSQWSRSRLSQSQRILRRKSKISRVSPSLDLIFYRIEYIHSVTRLWHRICTKYVCSHLPSTCLPSAANNLHAASVTSEELKIVSQAEASHNKLKERSCSPVRGRGKPRMQRSHVPASLTGFDYTVQLLVVSVLRQSLLVSAPCHISTCLRCLTFPCLSLQCTSFPSSNRCWTQNSMPGQEAIFVSHRWHWVCASSPL